MFRSPYKWSLAVGVPAVLMGTMLAQTSKGIIAGTVSDNNGAAIPNATVTVKSLDTGETRNTVTGPTGAYRVDGVNPGRYQIDITSKGFDNFELKNREVVASVVTTVDAQLRVGQTSETVTVEATNNSVETENGQISANISTVEVTQLPIASLNPVEVVLTEPGITDPGTRGMSNGINFSANGERSRSNNFLIDGQDDNDNSIGGQAYQPTNPEAVQEVSVLTNSYSAEFGRGGASVTNVITKSGTNKFHGSVWDYYQGSGLNAIDASAGLAGDATKARFDTHTFGFSVGGPIKKDKLFFFFTPQWTKFYGNGTGTAIYAPTAQGIADLNAIGTPNALLLTKYFANFQGPGTGTCVYTQTGGAGNCVHFALANPRIVSQKNPDTQYTTRLDYLATANDTLSLRYFHDYTTLNPDFFVNPGSLPGFDSQQGGPSENLGATWTHTFNPTTVNEFRASWGHFSFSFAPTASALANPLYAMPNISISDINASYFPTLGFDEGLPQGRGHQTYQFQDSITKTVGKHTFKTGVDIARILVKDSIPFNNRGILSYTSGGGYTGLGNFLDDFSGSGGSATLTYGNPVIEPKMFQEGYYFQDDWKIRENLTLNLGLRYEFSNNPENLLQYPAIDPYTELTSTNFSYTRVREDGNNWAPRLGFAYTPKFLPSLFGDGKTVLRGGYGMFYDSFFTNILDNTAGAAPNAVSGLVQPTTNDRGLAGFSGALATITPTLNPRSSVTSVAYNLANPLYHQWNLNVERELPGRFLAAIAYVGNHGEHLYANDQLNPYSGLAADGSRLPRLDPYRGSIAYRDNSASSNYNGLDLKLERRFAKGLMIRGSYTFSRALDNASEIFVTTGGSSYPQDTQNLANARHEEYGLSSYNANHRFAVATVWEVPGFRASNGLLDKLAYATRNWQWANTASLQSGLPNTPYIYGIDTNGDGIATNDRPTLGNPKAPVTTTGVDGLFTGGTPGVLYDATTGLPTTANAVHWIVQPGIGNVRRNSLYEPGIVTWNMSLARTFRVARMGEQGAFQLRADAFDVLNHANESNSNGFDTNVLDTTSFADPHNARIGGRTMRLEAKFIF